MKLMTRRKTLAPSRNRIHVKLLCRKSTGRKRGSHLAVNALEDQP